MQDVKMPQLGESVTEGTINRWLVKPGDAVKKYQPLAEVITDKVNAEIPAPMDGEILSLDVAEGATVVVGTRIATMKPAGATAAGGTAQVVASAVPAAGVGPVAGAAVETDRTAAARFSPAVMRLAQEHGIDLSRLQGTGMGGRITRKDLEGYLAGGGAAVAAPAQVAPPVEAPVTPPSAPVAPAAPVAAPAQAAPPVAASAPTPPGPGDQILPVDPVRRRIAEKMRQSKHEAPHAWTMVEVDVTGLVRLKAALGDEFKRREGISLSYVPFFIKAVVESLKEFPLINSQWAGDQILLKKEINISVAVATETALAVPVIKHADRLSIAGLNHAVADLAARARSGRLTLDDITGGTFTVNNTGSFGSVLSAPIINHPQAAILSFEAIVKRPVVLDGDAIAIRSMMNMCMSLDHRILDGLVAGRFLQAVKGRLEKYGTEGAQLY